MGARPPVKAANDKAAKRLIAAHREEYDDLVVEELANAGWAQKEVTVKKWTHQ